MEMPVSGGFLNRCLRTASNATIRTAATLSLALQGARNAEGLRCTSILIVPGFWREDMDYTILMHLLTCLAWVFTTKHAFRDLNVEVLPFWRELEKDVFPEGRPFSLLDRYLGSVLYLLSGSTGRRSRDTCMPGASRVMEQAVRGIHSLRDTLEGSDDVRVLTYSMGFVIWKHLARSHVALRGSTEGYGGVVHLAPCTRPRLPRYTPVDRSTGRIPLSANESVHMSHNDPFAEIRCFEESKVFLSLPLLSRAMSALSTLLCHFLILLDLSAYARLVGEACV